MDYTDEELDALHQEHLRDSGEELFEINPKNRRKIPLDELVFSDNNEDFETVRKLIANKSALSLEFGIHEGKQ